MMRPPRRRLPLLLLLIAAVVPALAACGGGDDGTAGGEMKAAHFVDSAPAYGQVLAAAPINVVVNTDSDLADGSSIEILLDGAEDYGNGEPSVDENSLTLRRAVREDAPDGTYVVRYRTCVADGSCADGRFGFEIDRERIREYLDLRGRAEVTVDMRDLKFQPGRIIVSPGTAVTWVNKDAAEHFVNTDPHPSHTYYLPQNSLGISRDATFTLSFDEAGEYLYHCSAHFPQGMTGSVIVQY